MARKKKEETKETPKKITKKKEEVKEVETSPGPQAVPPQAGTKPKVIKPVTEEIKQAAEQAPDVDKPLFDAGELQILHYAYAFAQQKKQEAGLGLEGVKLLHHDLELLAKVGVVAIQRTQLANEFKQKITALERELAVYKQAMIGASDDKTSD